jgi:hypothetical protein
VIGLFDSFSLVETDEISGTFRAPGVQYRMNFLETRWQRRGSAYVLITVPTGMEIPDLIPALGAARRVMPPACCNGIQSSFAPPKESELCCAPWFSAR